MDIIKYLYGLPSLEFVSSNCTILPVISLVSVTRLFLISTSLRFLSSGLPSKLTYWIGSDGAFTH